MKLNVDISKLENSSISLDRETTQKVKQQCVKWKKEGKLSFPNTVEEKTAEYTDINKIKEIVNLHQTGCTNKKIKHFVLLGTGGSSLGAETLMQALYSKYREPYFYFMNNNDPDFFSETLESLEAEITLFYVVSKSGETLETWSQFLVSIHWLSEHLPGENVWKKHVVLCTERNNGSLRNFGKVNDLSCLEVPESVGGRFSVFTPCSLFPAAFAGLNVEDIVDGARDIVEKYNHDILEDNIPLQLANSIYKNLKKNITVCFSYSSYLEAFGRWFEQLWGESLGKQGKGFSPFSAIGTTDQHSQLQLFLDGPKDKFMVFIHIESSENSLKINKVKDFKHILNGNTMWDLFQAEFQATKFVISEKGIPNFTISLKDKSEKSIGELLCFWFYITIYVAAFLEVDPFTQPEVEKGKALTKTYLRDSYET